MRRLRTRAIILVGVAALLPLAALGTIAVSRARRTLLDEAERTNRDIALRSAAQIEAQVERFREVLELLAPVLSPSVHLTPEQATHVLRDQRSQLQELIALDYVREDGREWASGRLDEEKRDRNAEPAVRAALAGSAYRSPVHVSDDLVPQMTLAVPQRTAGRVAGALVATVDLTEMWRVIDTLRVGQHGYARVVGEDGTLIAIGDHRLKRRVFTREKDDSSAIVRSVLAGRAATMRYAGESGEEILGVGLPVTQLGWGLILEQPVSEAVAPYLPFRRAILFLSAALLALAAAAGFLGARSIVRPIERLRVRAGEIARGLLDARVEVRAPEELSALAEAMNSMSSDLIRLHEEVRRQERTATIGRVAAGLGHDLKHPVRALESSATRMLQRPDDPVARRRFEEVVAREFPRIGRYLSDLHSVSQGGNVELARAPLDLAAMVDEFAAQQRETAPAGVEIVVEASGAPLPVLGNRELLERVLLNLHSNAFEAMEGVGRLRIAIVARGSRAELRISDSGPGIAPERRHNLFNDFTTTKRRGLGLGLAVCRKIVVDHGGTIDAESEPGQGATMIVRLPLAMPPPG